MDKRTLQKAKELETQIEGFKNAYDRIKSDTEIAICCYADGPVYARGYRHILTLDKEIANAVCDIIQKRIKNMEKELEEL